MNNKGMALDIIFIGVVLFIIAIGFLAINNGFNTAINQMKTNPTINSSNASVTALEATQTNVLGRMDYIVLGLFIGLTLALWVTGWMIGGNPIFTLFYFIVIVIAVVITSVLSGAWSSITSLAVFAGNMASFPVANHLISNLPFYVAIVGFIGLVLTFVKPFAMGE